MPSHETQEVLAEVTYTDVADRPRRQPPRSRAASASTLTAPTMSSAAKVAGTASDRENVLPATVHPSARR